MFSASLFLGRPDLPDDSLIVGFIERYARNFPEDIAIIDDQREITYAELDQRANGVAHGLVARGLGEGDAVFVCMRPGIGLLIALLGIHKAGCVYVPLDPAFPLVHMARVLQEVPPALIVHDGEDTLFPLDHRDQCIRFDEVALVHLPAEAPSVARSLDTPSHIFFTSGTTGNPKAVLSSQHNLLQYIGAAIKRFRFTSRDVFVAAARPSFSISLFELLIPLAVGGTVRILSREKILNLESLADAIASSTVFHLGPGLLKRLLPHIEMQYGRFDRFDGVRHASSGGDFVPVSVLKSMRRIFRNAEVCVIYGSSEINCMGCCFSVPKDSQVEKSLVGKPFTGMTLRVLDASRSSVAPGEIGEVYFAGRGLAVGYINRPELTRERFVQLGGQRFYAMGDLGRLDARGNLELLGRNDFQVQIRGMRVELTAVEECLRNLPGVADCIVVAREDGRIREKVLVAYLVAEPGREAELCLIHEHAVRNLPDYMVPSQFVRLSELPLNFNGKIDRKALPPPDSDNQILSADFMAPRNEIEKLLAGIWQTVLEVDRVGINDDFFELGGDSLRAVSFLVEVENVLGKFIPIAFLMEHPTIREIARAIEEETALKEDCEVVVLRKGNADPPLFCLYGVMLYRDLAESLKTSRMVCGVYVREEIDVIRNGVSNLDFDAFWDVSVIAARYLEIIRCYQQTGPYYLCGESFGGVVALEVARMLREQGEEVRLVAMLDSVAPGYYDQLGRTRRMALHMMRMAEEGPASVFSRIWSRLSHREQSSSSERDLDELRSQVREYAFSRYLPRLYEGDVHLFRAQERSAFDPDLEDLGWRRWLPDLKIYNVAGDHLSILRKGQVEHMAAILSGLLV